MQVIRLHRSEKKADNVNRENRKKADCKQGGKLVFILHFQQLFAVLCVFELFENIVAAEENACDVSNRNLKEDAAYIDKRSGKRVKRHADGDINNRCGHNKGQGFDKVNAEYACNRNGKVCGGVHNCPDINIFQFIIFPYNNGNNNSGGKNSYPDPEGSRIFNIFNVQSFHLVTHKYTLLLPQKQEI